MLSVWEIWQMAQSHQRRFRRWLSNRRLEVMSIHHALMSQALSEWVQVVALGKRPPVDAHWYRGISYLKLGWNWIRLAITQQWNIQVYRFLSSLPDPQPAIASK